MSTNYNGVFKISEGLESLADKLHRLGTMGERKLEQAVRETTLLTHEAIVEKITNDIEPHSGLSRKRNPKETVTDLVDTGFYRSSWNVSFDGPLKGRVGSNAEYAPVLEYGTEDGTHKGFYVARDTARKMQPIFAEKIKQVIRELTK